MKFNKVIIIMKVPVVLDVHQVLRAEVCTLTARTPRVFVYVIIIKFTCFEFEINNCKS